MKKSERLLNLLILLMVQRTVISKQRIRRLIPDYAELGDAAFDRMFDRDKDELRELGIPVEVGSVDAYFEEPGYRVRPDEFALPSIELTAAEAAAVGLAGRVWQHAGLAGAVSDALAKLNAAGADIDRSRLDLVGATVAAQDPNFDVLWQAAVSRARVVFDYRSAGGAQHERRELEPWGVVSFAQRWYVVGWDATRRDERIFRLSRIVGAAERHGRGGAFEVPEHVDLRGMVRRFEPADASRIDGTVLLRHGTGHALRRSAAQIEVDVPGPDQTTAWDRVLVRDVAPWVLADDVLMLGRNAVAEGPALLREALIARLDDALEAG